MGSFYNLQIECDSEKKKEIDAILGASDAPPDAWWNLTIEEDNSDFTSALPLFIDLITTHLSKLQEIGITADLISFWYMYEYEQQCNMEFSPAVTKRLGELGITLCISCWEK